MIKHTSWPEKKPVPQKKEKVIPQKPEKKIVKEKPVIVEPSIEEFLNGDKI